MKKLALALMAMSTMFFGFGMVAEAQYGGGNPGASVPSGTVPPGGNVVISVTGCRDGELLTVRLNGVVIVSAPCRRSQTITGSVVAAVLPQQAATGTAQITFAAPTTPGTYTYQITGDQGFSQSVTVTVGAVGGGGLPATGSDGVNTTLLLGLGLFGVGAGLFGVSHYRRRSVAAA